jgi:hypothetical protein
MDTNTKRNAYGWIEKNRKGFIIRQSTLMKTSMDDILILSSHYTCLPLNL